MKIAELMERAKRGEPVKIKRDAFLYMAPKEPKKEFAQCASCVHFLPKKERCALFGPNLHVPAEASCGLYLHGEPNDKQEATAVVSPKEAGFVKRKVRCENCISFDDGFCKLYAMLNKDEPEIFDLDEKVDPQGCCNGQTPKV